MKNIDRYNLVCNIALKLQAEFNTSGINVFLGSFGVEHDMVNIVPSKRVYVEGLLSNVPDSTVIRIARDLGFDVPNSSTESSRVLQNYLSTGGYQAAIHDFERALAYVSSDPEQALGSASSTLESICKAILERLNFAHPKDESLQYLLRLVFERMNLSPEGHADPDIKRVLGGLLNAAVGVGVLRTKYSGFHGKSMEQKRKRLTDRHARLSVNSASAVGLFLIETYSEMYA
ncbi:abortive infection family protein [Marinimicrobium locisalis]|uniref:abortive infection family protein n=1 Tax=Marinimicrobium locisalis TaxID=546022 RepID=UPI0032216A3D